MCHTKNPTNESNNRRDMSAAGRRGRYGHRDGSHSTAGGRAGTVFLRARSATCCAATGKKKNVRRALAELILKGVDDEHGRSDVASGALLITLFGFSGFMLAEHGEQL